MAFKKIYKDLDLLKIPISLSFRNEYLYMTISGASLTIICFIILFIYSIISIKELFEKSSFTVITHEYQSPNDEINLTNVPILFSLTDKYGNPMELDSKLFELSVVYSVIENKYVKGGNTNFTHIEKKIEI